MPALLRVSLTVLAFAVLGGAALTWLSEARRAAAHNRILEGDVAAGVARGDALDTRCAGLVDDLALADERADARDERIAFLEDELRSAIGRAEEIGLAVESKRAGLEQFRDELAERRRRTRGPMPEGVRLALLALEGVLRDDGFTGLRFVEARALEAQTLREVEVVERSANGTSVTYFRAGKLSCELDRAAGQVILRMRDGHAVRDGLFVEFPDTGFELRLEDVNGADWERRLPYLVVAEGQYPVDPELAGELEELDPLTRDRWAQRVGVVLDAAQTELSFRVGRFRTVRDGRLLDASLHGYDDRKLLAQSAEARALAIEIDREVGTVSLLLEDGVLRKSGGETTIPKSGYRILLPGVTPRQAIDAMLGFVVYRR